MMEDVQVLNRELEINIKRKNKQLTTVFSGLVVGELDKSEIFKALTELGMIKEFGEIIPDVFHSTSLKYCLESEGN